MTEEHVVAEGLWCPYCEFFEDDLTILGKTCPSCGCAKENHIKVKLVKTGELWPNVAPELTPEQAKEV